ncbi:hypothetical protein [Streptomyces beihaiensis]|uniref:Cysteinyl-tRNA synthetase n=1 Tax=Streptomyces beihaiensis TaxID=2984495 RepID=A0ABT3TWR3_9ACTN|nr:hypothetical protein [Streptomyces beihaiensis]MCX3060931.1 hypothetical protein [Streptomyces beihaiensis]
MLTMTDGRTGRAVPLSPAHRRPLRVCAQLPEGEDGAGATAARVLVLTDVLMRTVESGGGQVDWVCETADPAPEHHRRLRSLTDALGVRPPSAFTGPGEATALLGGPPDVRVLADGTRDGDQGLWLETGTVRRPNAPEPPLDADPLPLRLALLSLPYRSPLTLPPLALTEAERALREWRRAVADWARAPSKPVPDAFRSAAATALADDLDTPAVVALLRRAETSDDLPNGAKFETFALLDHYLGLELTREIGRWTGP